MLTWWPMQHGCITLFLTRSFFVAIEWPHVHSIAKFKQLTTKNCHNDSMVTKSITIIWWQPNWSHLFDGNQISHSYFMAIKNGKGWWVKFKKVNKQNIAITIQWWSNQDIELRLPLWPIFLFFPLLVLLFERGWEGIIFQILESCLSMSKSPTIMIKGSSKKKLKKNYG
jgi:hypothetical protein